MGHFEKGRYIETLADWAFKPVYTSSNIPIQLPNGKLVTIRELIYRLERLESIVIPEHWKVINLNKGSLP